jgi:hypothetical protein
MNACNLRYSTTDRERQGVQRVVIFGLLKNRDEEKKGD